MTGVTGEPTGTVTRLNARERGGDHQPERVIGWPEGLRGLAPACEMHASRGGVAVAITPKTIVLVVAGIVVVGGSFVAAPLVGDAFTQSLAPSGQIMGDPVEFGVNASGETYGSPLNDRVPDLILTRAEGGKTGYVRVSELDLARNAKRSALDPNAVFDIPVYESDGMTQIGTFRVMDDTPSPRDGFNK